MLKKTLTSLLVLLVVMTSAYSQDLKSTTVAGFINKGDNSFDNINIQMTKSMVAFLSKLSKNISPYPDTAETAQSQGFWNKKTFDSADAISVAQTMGNEQVITGDYSVNSKSEIISINVYVYDVVTGKLKLERKYSGNAGIDLFDTIDKMIKDVSGLLIGKSIDFGTFQLTVGQAEKTYKLYINGSFIKAVSKKIPFTEKFLSGQKIDVRLVNPEDDREIFRNYFDIIKGKVTEYNYYPFGTVIVKVMDGVSDVFVNGKLYGRTDSSGTISITNVAADQNLNITSKAVDQTQGNAVVRVKEGESKVVVLENPSNRKRLIYFPVKFGLMGGYLVQAGVSLRFLNAIEAGVTGGVLANTFEPGTSLSFLPLVEVKAGYFFPLTENFKIGAVLSGIAVIGKTAVISPMTGLEIELFQITAGINVRYSLQVNEFYPAINLGYTF